MSDTIIHYTSVDCSINKKDVLLLNTEPEIHNKKTKAGANAPALSGLSKNLNHSYQNHIVPSAIL
ncbi:hypothetical protein K410107C12_15340 [Agathobacter rectalis]